MNNLIFDYLFQQYKSLVDAGQQHTEKARHLFGEMMRYAPPEYQRAAHEIAVAEGLLPAVPDGYSDAGEPLYRMNTMLERLGLTEDDIPDDMRQHLHVGPVHRVQ